MSATLEELTALGIEQKKAEEALRNKNLAAALKFWVTEAASQGLSGDAGKVVFDVAQKVKAEVADENKRLVLSYVLKTDGDSISAPEKLQAAVKYVNNAGKTVVSEEEFRAASGVGVVVTADALKEAVASSISASEADLAKDGWFYQVKIMEQVKRVLPFASGKEMRDEIEAQLTAKLGPKDDGKDKKKELLKEKRKEKKESKAEEAGPAPVAEAAKAPEATAATEAPAAEGEAHKGKQVVTPWDVQAGEGEVIDYQRLMDDFGSQPITPEQIERMKKLGMPIHRFLRRGIFFSHRDLDFILDQKEKGEPIYLYTGRGPSSQAMHLGHLVPFLFTQYLQEAFGVRLVVQMTDDEKFLFKESLTLDEHETTGVVKMLYENAKDIIACGFCREKTFIFSDLEYMGGDFYKNILRVQKKVTLNKACNVFGFQPEDNIGKVAFAATQIAPALPSSFPGILPTNAACLIPCAIDQDPYFRIARDICPSLGAFKPSLLHSKFFPAMTGSSTKMSSSVAGAANTTVFLTDTPDEIATKVRKYAFSGAPSTLAEHRAKGANTDVDVAYQYLTFFLEDDEELARIQKEYSQGRMTTGEVKEILIKELQTLVANHQARRAQITHEELRYYMSADKFKAN